MAGEGRRDEPKKIREKSKPPSSRANKQLSEQEILIGEELKIAVNVAVDRFVSDENKKELEFPSSLTANERAYVHRYCKELGLITKSRGKGNKRYLTVYKVVEKSVTIHSKLHLSRSSSNIINSLLQDFPVTSRDKHELSGQKLHKGIVNEQNKILARENRLVLGNSPHIPADVKETEIRKKAKHLPIYDVKEKIVEVISKNQVVLIAGDTGSGKTTQVPQFLLEEHHKSRTPCRIICTQPRRLSAISIAERISAERGERVGQTVGYQIRLESKLSSKTLLHFCTTGVLLRLLMVGHKCLSNITHIIVDEIHERDSLSDFLLISLRDLLKNYKKLKIVLMSAALNVSLFTNYFGKCPVIQVNGTNHDVKTYFLEDVLKQTGYLSKPMKKMMEDGDQNLFKLRDDSSAAADVMKLIQGKDVVSPQNEQNDEPMTYLDEENVTDVEIESESESESEEKKKTEEEDDEVDERENNADVVDELEQLDITSDDHNDQLTDTEEHDEKIDNCEEMDSALAQAWLSGDDEAFDQIIHLIMNENVHIDYQHSETKMTSLIVAAARGKLTLTEQLIEFGAQPDIQDPKNNRNALEWANHFNQTHVVQFLKGLAECNDDNTKPTAGQINQEDLTENDKRRLELYHKSFDDQRIDNCLIIALLTHICKTKQVKGSILIFLPGYDEIITLRDKLKQDKEFSKRGKYQFLMLHSMLPSGNQKKIFGRPPPGVQKIILSTNIAETGITIDDVACVIDSGKVKEKNHDAISSVSTLRTVWISKASAVQRRGRAGRCMAGLCYHLFSQDRFHHFQTYQEAEILRVPIHTLCLQTKMLAPVNISISDYLAKAPESPSNLITRSSIRMLKSISALDDNEEMTDLGKLLVEFPIDPQFGKIVLMGMVLKCLEPAIIIACCSSTKEPFLLPTVASQKSSAVHAKLKLSSDSYSDQISMLRAFQGWQRAKREGKEKFYCSRNYISLGTMEMVSRMRRQIIGLLRTLGLLRSRGLGNMKDLNQNSRNWSVIKAAVGSGLYPNFIKVDKEKSMLLSEKEKKVTVHNSSVLLARSEDKVQSTVSRAKKLNSTIATIPLDWLVYEELSRLYYSVQIRSVSVLSQVAVALVGGPCLSYDHSSLRLKSPWNKKGRSRHDRGKENLFQESDSEQDENEDEDGVFKIDDWISFTGDDSTLYAIAMLRIKFLALFSKHIQIPCKPWSQSDVEIIQAIADVLNKEEQIVGLSNPATKDIDKKRNHERRYERHQNQNVRGHSPNSNPNDYMTSQFNRRDGSKKSSDEQGDGKNNAPHDNHAESGEKSRERSYFILKCNNERNMGISFRRNIWATTKSNEKRLHRAFIECEEVFLIFSVQGSGRFQGVAKMVSGISENSCEDFGSANLGGVFDIEWLHQEELSFQATQHLVNPWNDNKKVQISRDAQEVEPRVGKALVDLWERNSEVSQCHVNVMEVSPSEEKHHTSDENNSTFFTPEVYGSENEPQYLEEYPLYSPPPFSPQFIPEYQQLQTHYSSPHIGFQQHPYPMYAAPTGEISPYRQHDYYPFHYSPRRNLDLYQKQVDVGKKK